MHFHANYSSRGKMADSHAKTAAIDVRKGSLTETRSRTNVGNPPQADPPTQVPFESDAKFPTLPNSGILAAEQGK